MPGPRGKYIFIKDVCSIMPGLAQADGLKEMNGAIA